MPQFPDAEIIRTVERSKRDLLVILNKNHDNIHLTNIPSLAEDVENEIVQHLVSIILKHSEFIFSLKPAPEGPHLLDSSNKVYHLFYGPNVDLPTQFIFKLHNIPSQNQKMNELVVRISGYGKYSEVLIILPKLLDEKTKYPVLYYWIKEIFEAGYFWFFETVAQIVNEDCENLSKRLYGYVQKYITSEELRKNLWFSAITDGFGFRLLNEHVTKESFRLIQRNLHALDYSANRYVAELLCTYLPEDIMLMKKVFDKNKCIDVNLKDAKYKKEGSIYALTLASLYGCDSFTIYPIYVGEKLSIANVFDTKQRKYIEPILDAHKNSLSEICKEETENVKKILKILRHDKIKSFWDAVELQPNFLGIGFNIKKMFGTGQSKKK